MKLQKWEQRTWRAFIAAVLIHKRKREPITSAWYHSRGLLGFTKLQIAG